MQDLLNNAAVQSSVAPFLAGLLVAGVLIWYSLAALALVPVLVRLPLPKAPAWVQAVVAALYAAAAAVGSWVLAWLASRGSIG